MFSSRSRAALLRADNRTRASVADASSSACCFLARPLIKSDIQMPRMSGLEATEAIRRLERERLLPPVHIIALSASTSTEDKEQAFRAGVNDYGAGEWVLPRNHAAFTPPLHRREGHAPDRSLRFPSKCLQSRSRSTRRWSVWLSSGGRTDGTPTGRPRMGWRRR